MKGIIAMSIKALTEAHFNLVGELQMLQDTIRKNQRETVEALVSAKMFDAFSVNWRRLDRNFKRDANSC